MLKFLCTARVKDQRLVNEYTYGSDSAGEPSVSGSTKYWPYCFLTACDFRFYVHRFVWQGTCGRHV